MINNISRPATKEDHFGCMWQIKKSTVHFASRGLLFPGKSYIEKTSPWARLSVSFGALYFCVLHVPFSKHSVGYSYKAGNISSLHIVNVTVWKPSMLPALLVNVLHDHSQPAFYFFLGPVHANGVL